MDTLSHGLYAAVAFGRKNKMNFWLAFFFGIAPDIFSFGIFIATTFLGLAEHPDWSNGRHPDPSQIPLYVHTLYNLTHSLIIFGIVFLLVWLYHKKPLYEMFGWALHILVDIPTHSAAFFPTPFLWPVSDFYFQGHSWSDPRIFIPNVILLIILYAWFFIRSRLVVKK